MSGTSLPASAPASHARLQTPGLARRMACLVYEGVLLFGVLMAAGLLYAGLTDQRHAMMGRHGLQVLLFVVLGLYFGWFWSHGGQTVAMKAWRIRIERADGAPVSMGRALARYLAGWCWFAPALLSLWLADAAGSATIVVVLGLGVVAYALLTVFHPDRQFWHDAVCGTRLVDWRGNPPGHDRGP